MDASPPRPPAAIDLVLGYDGSDPATRALEWAMRILAGRAGTLRIVHVTHSATGAGLSGLGYAEMMEAEDEVDTTVRDAAAERLAATDVSWTFQRRQGAPGDELLAEAKERAAGAPSGTETVLVVGRSAGAIHQVIGSVPVALLRHSPYPVLTIP